MLTLIVSFRKSINTPKQSLSVSRIFFEIVREVVLNSFEVFEIVLDVCWKVLKFGKRRE